MAKPDDAGRVIAGLLTYNPGPGIYSRLERAIQAMPENVRTQELPGLLKRYKDGVPGWELKAVDLDSVIGQRPAVSREELLQAVKERSPVYTHKEVVLADTPPMETIPGAFGGLPHYQDEASAIGRGIAHGDPKYQDYGQGGRGYTEILLTQPGARSAGEYYNHWGQAATQATSANRDAVAHARFDTHGDALRINELQSDLGIHNRKMRERLDKTHATSEADYPLPFPLEDAWSDLLIKRLALEAAGKGHRAIEVASPRAIADKVGGNIDNYEHLYGKVVPGALERLGRKMGGLVEEVADARAAEPVSDTEDWLRSRGMHRPGQLGYDSAHELRRVLNEQFPSGREQGTRGIGDTAYNLLDRIRHGSESPEPVAEAEYLRDALWGNLERGGLPETAAIAAANDAMPHLLRQYEAMRAARNRNWNSSAALTADVATPARRAAPPAGRRYLMSDEMRRRLIQEGVGAAVATGIMSQDDLINRLNQ